MISESALGSGHTPNVDAANFIVSQLAPSMPDVVFVLIGTVGDAVAHLSIPQNVLLPSILICQTFPAQFSFCIIASRPDHFLPLGRMFQQPSDVPGKLCSFADDRLTSIFDLVSPRSESGCDRRTLSTSLHSMKNGKSAVKSTKQQWKKV